MQYKFDEQMREKKRKELRLASSTLTICHIERFDKVKNHNFILDIFEKLLKKRPDAHLLLIGDGVLRKQTENKAKEKGILAQVRFLGVRRDVNELLQAADVLVFPSLFEGLGIAVVEAQCTGMPCIISDIIPNEVMITDLVEKVSLHESASIWAEKLIRKSGLSRIRHQEQQSMVGGVLS